MENQAKQLARRIAGKMLAIKNDIQTPTPEYVVGVKLALSSPDSMLQVFVLLQEGVPYLPEGRYGRPEDTLNDEKVYQLTIAWDTDRQAYIGTAASPYDRREKITFVVELLDEPPPAR